jgi:signal transduction histidine kinase
MDWFQGVLEAGREFASAQTPEEVEKRAIDAAVRLLRAERCRSVPIDSVEPLVLRAVAAGQPVIDGAPQGRLLCAPVFRGRSAAFCLLAERAEAGPFAAIDAHLAGFIGVLAGVALDNAAHLEAQRRAETEVRNLTAAAIRGQEEERRRLALALHDGASQGLSAVLLQLARLAKNAPADVSTQLNEVRSLTRSVLDDLRGITHGLRPPALDRLGLAAALRELAKNSCSDELHVEAIIHPPQMRSPPPEVSIAFFRIAQEALANLIKHAHARNGTLRLYEWQGRLRLEISDDGLGFDPARLPADAGLGLIGMRERSTWLGGTFALESAPGRGTRIAVETPVSP